MRLPGIVTFIVAVGMVLQTQLPAVVQLVLTAPVQVLAEAMVIITSSVDAVHGLFDIVHRKVYAVPAVPVNADVPDDGVVTVPPVPDMMLHAPVPAEGVFAASVIPHSVPV